MSQPIAIDVQMMDAIRQAERLATDRPELHAAIYRRQVVGSVDTLYVRLSDEPAPEGAELVTTVSRKPPEVAGNQMTLRDAVRQVVANLPVGVVLRSSAVVEFYPPRPYTNNDRRVFAYQFISTEGRNVATWIPDVSMNGVGMQPGVDGRGRPWHQEHMKNIGHADIGHMIETELPATDVVRMSLSPESSEVFAEALIAPPEPNEHLKKAFESNRRHFKP